MFGLGRINFVQGRYEIAERCFIKSYEAQRDFTYRVWLGFTQLKLASICTKENPKKFRNAQNAFMNLDRCSRDVKVGLYANFGLLKLASDFYGEAKLPSLQEPYYYAILIKSDFSPLKFEGTLAQALVDLRTKSDEARGLKSLNELATQRRPLAYFCLIRAYLKRQDAGMACQIAEQAFK